MAFEKMERNLIAREIRRIGRIPNRDWHVGGWDGDITVLKDVPCKEHRKKGDR